MDELMDYNVFFKPESPLITPLQSDTIFGHVAWAIRYLWRETTLTEFLDAFQDGKDAPLLISDGFPAGQLPKPILKALPQRIISKHLHEIAETKQVDFELTQQTQIMKALKKKAFIGVDTFKKIQQDCTPDNLLKVSASELDWDKLLSGGSSNRGFSESSITMHNTVNRIHGKVTEGLYQQTEYFYQDDFQFEVYLKTNYFDLTQLIQIFEMIASSGFGRDKSTGKGKFSIKIEKYNRLPDVPDANAFITLSHYVPDPSAPTKGWYRLMTKYGRLGGDYASSPIPFKKPLLMMKPGSVFWGKPADNYGMLLGGKDRPKTLQVHTIPDIRHFAYAFPVGIKAREEDFEQ